MLPWNNLALKEPDSKFLSKYLLNEEMTHATSVELITDLIVPAQSYFILSSHTGHNYQVNTNLQYDPTKTLD